MCLNYFLFLKWTYLKKSSKKPEVAKNLNTKVFLNY